MPPVSSTELSSTELSHHGVVCAGIIPAAGSGQRLGGGQPKALRVLGDQPLYVWGVRLLAAHPAMRLVVVATPGQWVDSVRAQLAAVKLGCPVQVVAGGATRQASVELALANLPQEVTHVVVHDAARPLTPTRVLNSVVQCLTQGASGVIPALAVADTIKEVVAAGLRSNGESCPRKQAAHDTAAPVEVVRRTVPRHQLRAVQTPQGFDREMLVRAHQRAASGGDAEASSTDDASLVELLGETVWVVAGAQEAFKITTAQDFLLANLVVNQGGVG